jgi:hypothetical protein
MPFLGILLYIIGALIVGLCGKDRVMRFWGFFFASILFTPVIGMFLVLVARQADPLPRN